MAIVKHCLVGKWKLFFKGNLEAAGLHSQSIIDFLYI